MTPVNTRVFQKGFLVFTALFALFWAILRASIQSITLDESDTYFWFAAQSASHIWYPMSNNHVLNTLLMWMTTHAFGASIIAVRAPALAGALLYIVVCYFLSRQIADRIVLQFTIFICLTYNPLIFDFMVAARGYSLADAFLLAAIAVPVWHRTQDNASLRTSCILASVALGLSFSANFSFGFVDLAALVGILIWAIRRREGEPIRRVVEFCALPGLFIALLLCGYPLMHWKKEELWWGAHSLSEMTESLVHSSLYQLDPGFREAGLYRLMSSLKPLLLPLLGVLCAAQIVATRIDGSWQQDERSRWMGRFAAGVGGMVGLSVLMSWLAFRFYNLPLPIGRTGIYLVPLCTLIAGMIGSAPARSVASMWLRKGITGVFVCLACYFVLCLRLTYFREYEWDANIKEVYSVLARLNHAYGVKEVAMNGFYVSPLNYYRMRSKRETFPEFTSVVGDPPVGKAIYVLPGVYYRRFIEEANLVVIYCGQTTDIVVAVSPDGVIPARMVEP